MTFDTLFPQAFIQALLAMLAIIVLDLALGVSVAIKTKTFDLKKLSDFYTTSVIPNIIGWAAADVVLRLAGTLDVPIITTVGNIGIVTLYAVACASLLGDLTSKFNVLQQPLPQLSPVINVAVTPPTQESPQPTAEVIKQ
jgi:hypothetical protein